MIFIGGGSSNWKIKVERQVERQQLEVDGAKVSLRFWPGRGTPLVLLHGFMDSSQGFDNLARHTHRPCYAFDLPGFGESMRAANGKVVATAILSRQGAGVRGRTLIITLPGSPNAISTSLEAVFAAVPYCLDLIGAARIETDPAIIKAHRPMGA